MKQIAFWKMSGSGNDFVVIDNRDKKIAGGLPKLAMALCHRQFGVGADGLLLLEPSAKADFRMVYFNSDGSRASMCGNGARCLAWVAHEKGVVDGRFTFETDAGLVKGYVEDRVVEITLSDAVDYRPQFALTVGGRPWKLSYINTGVPHAVIEVPDVAKIDLMKWGKLFRFHRAFGPKGTNVNFIERTGAHSLTVRTYERGVEGETLACGTGVSACAIAAALRGRVSPKVRCKTTGGDVLEVGFALHADDPKHPATQVTLKGPVRRTFVGEAAV